MNGRSSGRPAASALAADYAGPRHGDAPLRSRLQPKRPAGERVLWAEHQLRERPHKSVEAVWAFHANETGARHVEYLLLELREAADVAGLTPSVERGDRLGPDCKARHADRAPPAAQLR